MNKSTNMAALILMFHLGFSGLASAEVFINLDFETPDTGLSPVGNKPYPKWTLQPTFDSNYGPGNHFEISDTTSHSGNYSLKFVYEGRNGFCNTCGIKGVTHKKGLDGVDYFVDHNGNNLTLDSEPLTDKNGIPVLNNLGTPIQSKLPHASPGKVVFNKTNGYSKWEVVSVENENSTKDKLMLKLLRPGIGSFSTQTPVFNGGDEVAIARKCGVDGVIGKVNGVYDVDRRSDCNNVITWFGKVFADRMSSAKIQAGGTSIFRRVYLKTEYVNPPTGNKLNYARLLRGGPASTEVVLVADFAKGTNAEPHLTGLGRLNPTTKGRYFPGNGLPNNLKFERGEWYYIEQEYKSETYTINMREEANGTIVIDSYKGNGDGEYRLWFAKSGEETSTPILDERNLALPPLVGGNGTHMSLWGNHGHHTHTYGAWYMDDIVISDTYVGPVQNPNGKNTTASKPPIISSK